MANIGGLILVSGFTNELIFSFKSSHCHAIGPNGIVMVYGNLVQTVYFGHGQKNDCL